LVTQEVNWDLTPLFPGITDPKIEQSFLNAKTLADSFEQKWRGKIITLNPQGLLDCLRSMEAFEQQNSDLSLYAGLVFAANMTLPQTQTLNDRVNKLDAQLGKQLAFFSLELGKLLKANPQFIQDPLLSNYRHMLERVYRRVEHQLSEVEEQLIIEKDQFGVNRSEERRVGKECS
jgi:oligoendopeptidase F